ncbi:cation diffusion facilitator family transporter [Marinobacter persicus]|jgi:cation diffusion facilitator family transporter|uniref:Cation diffusion facilitator family transporter n=1 Tax=Marinobacter persicus TaxID=930118 RepID=A0A2S6G3Z3_9GAMM|nr:cation diffusion facilitator family transporter [Marinobacter persicus]KXS54131.1 MAG: cation efflux protein [Marinobacter sp. T13-3]PPK50553.1 cation diffusion facilitator family transporter [Marinobacter persicus]PPK53828.1 cation diffusion facilitator family transporter [Marinobacter persicus]PPK57064.1 cation diffusion facilitator family transporter [Marinobacter persicus]
MEQPSNARESHEQNLQLEKTEAAKVTVIGMVLDAVLGIIKVIAGTLFHSQALVVDGVHSFTDVASDFVVLGTMHLSRRGPDADHPYGHQRIETLGTMILGSFLIAVGGALGWENLQGLITGEELFVPGWPVLVAAGVSVASKEWIYRYTRRVGLRIRSDLIIANAWHSRTDAFSSVVVLVSTAGAMLGLVWLDALAAVIIAGIIIHIGWKFTWDSVKELIDTGLSEEDTEELQIIARETDGVRNVHELRTRRMGHDVLLDVHLVVRPDISVSEGHQIGTRVVASMREKLDNIRDINFHIDAENDEVNPHITQPHLPSREEIRTILADTIGGYPLNSRLRLHYLKNRVHLEIFLDEAGSPAGLTARTAREALEGFDWFGSVKVWQPAN